MRFFKAIILTLTVGLTALTVPAQNSETTLVANIPFDFTIGQQTLPAGEYRISRLSQTSSVIVMRTLDGRAAKGFQTIPARAKVQNTGRLVFNKYGDQYFLSQIWAGGQEAGSQLAKSAAEREAAKSMTDKLATKEPEQKSVPLVAARKN